MDIETKYLVVDLETTGTKWKQGDRIIQFAATLVEKDHLTQQYNFLINPKQPISERISELTNLTNDQLAQQPPFAFYAPKIQALLQDVVFVAHNVNFDWPFLQDALRAAGYAVPNIAAIDTVQLAQILLPQAPSFKLSDLTRYLNIEHDQPHQADSDAAATAQLFLYLKQRLQHLPVLTLKTLQRFSGGLLRQTGDFIDSISEQMQNQPAVLAADLVEVHHLILKRPTRSSHSLPQASKFPLSLAKKKQLLGPKIELRPQQMKMMNFVYRKIITQTPLALIDAPTGMGKTLGYLLPLSYAVDQGQVVVIATSTKLLQQQLLQEALPILNHLRQHHYSAITISSPYNYLDLDDFYFWLFHAPIRRSTAIVKMRLLVWLTQTETGNLNELNLTNYDNDFFKLIRSNGHRQQSQFHEYEFWQRRQHQVAQSDFIITNQAYLLRSLNTKIWPDSAILVVDEASSLLNHSLQLHACLTIGVLKTALKKTSDLLYQNRVTLRVFFTTNQLAAWTHDDLSSLQAAFDTFTQQLAIFQADLSSHYLKKLVPLDQRQKPITLALNPEQILPLTLQRLEKLARSLQSILLKLSKLFDLYEAIQPNTPIIINRIIYQLRTEYSTLVYQERQIEDLLASGSIWRTHTSWILQQTQYHNWDSLSLGTQLFDQSNYLTALQEQFSCCLFIGGTLAYHHSFQNFQQQLGLTQPLDRQQKLILKRDFALETRLQVYVAEHIPPPRAQADYEQQLTQCLWEILKSQSGKVLILFNSLTTIQTVVSSLATTNLANQWEFLVQGNGSNARLQKRFALGRQVVLFATQSFGEGVNLAPHALKLVIITHLPFDALDDPLVQAKSDFWRRQHLNSFTVESLPTATRRLKQQVGRLIRTPEDRGVLLFLDSRIADTRYGQQMYRELGLPKYQVFNSNAAIVQQLKMFL